MKWINERPAENNGFFVLLFLAAIFFGFLLGFLSKGDYDIHNDAVDNYSVDFAVLNESSYRFGCVDGCLISEDLIYNNPSSPSDLYFKCYDVCFSVEGVKNE